ncbi:VOC family protein [Streptomyces sp. NPDC093105]|uniref:VOC family protein n=1 Tax=Streptomyces sp. NPDC093105 TaxID=3366029 RepID=UPI0037FB9118
MSDRNHYDAFEMSPVPTPGPDAVPPEPFHGIYGMPSFVTVPTTDLAESVDFWTRGLGFFELFGIPGVLVHLRRWASQDVLLVVAESVPDEPPAMGYSFAGVLGQVDRRSAWAAASRPTRRSPPTTTASAPASPPGSTTPSTPTPAPTAWTRPPRPGGEGAAT